MNKNKVNLKRVVLLYGLATIPVIFGLWIGFRGDGPSSWSQWAIMILFPIFFYAPITGIILGGMRGEFDEPKDQA